MRTRATRVLDSLGIPYKLLEFEAKTFTAAEAAERLGLPLEQVFKTLVVRSDRGTVMLACVPGNRELSLRLLARHAGVKWVEMVEASELMRLVGYLKGAVSPLGTRRDYPVFIDASALHHERISISAGVRGLQIWIDPRDLIKATGAKMEILTEAPVHG
ncbi:MAG: aminoacyl-tRNA deacylase [Armatimonadota bacterium]|nr:aminoacyl-tRNA deacylase [Armatimonadota bacterium]MDR7435493.1 aminoacyl-tRNA deacylase [Armatimonadota bacterium]